MFILDCLWLATGNTSICLMDTAHLNNTFFPDIFAKHDVSHVFIDLSWDLTMKFVYSLYTHLHLCRALIRTARKMLFGTLVLY